MKKKGGGGKEMQARARSKEKKNIDEIFFNSMRME